MSRQVPGIELFAFGTVIALPTAPLAISRPLAVAGGSGADIVVHTTERTLAPTRCRDWQLEPFFRTQDTGLVGCLPTLSPASNGR